MWVSKAAATVTYRTLALGTSKKSFGTSFWKYAEYKKGFWIHPSGEVAIHPVFLLTAVKLKRNYFTKTTH